MLQHIIFWIVSSQNTPRNDDGECVTTPFTSRGECKTVRLIQAQVNRIEHAAAHHLWIASSQKHPRNDDGEL